MRLIDAEALKKHMEEECAEECAICCYANSGDGCRCNLIENAPTVELTEEQAIDKLHETGWLIRHDKEMTERPHGEWIEKIYTEKLGHGYLTHHDIVCSVCGDSGEDDEGIPQNYKFCPNCGADMRGDANGR